MAITASTISSLVGNKSSFIFATHMHELLDLELLRTMTKDQMRISHLSISYDETSKILVYDRKLQEGAGASIYGIMVARSLDLPPEFIEYANSVLLEITGQNKNVVEPTPSRYNNKVYVDSCALCNKSRSQTQLHTHHIIEQKEADNRGIVTKTIDIDDKTQVNVGTMHKNVKDNLIVLCHDCHINLHRRHEELETADIGNGKIIRVRPESIEKNNTPTILSSYPMTV
jgi:DNA mismatch repair protein MutS